MNHWTKQKEPNSFKEHYSGDLKFKKEIKKRKVLHCIIWDFTLSGLDLEQVHAHGNWIALSSLQTTITQGPKSCPIEPMLICSTEHDCGHMGLVDDFEGVKKIGFAYKTWPTLYVHGLLWQRAVAPCT